MGLEEKLGISSKKIVKKFGKKKDILNRVVFQAGRKIVEQGDTGMRAYFIEKGRVEVVVDDRNHHLKVAELGPGEVFGEMTLMNGAARTATVRAKEATTVVVLSHSDLLERIDKISDRVLKALMKVTIQRLEDTTRGQMDQFKTMTDFDGGIESIVDRVQMEVSDDRRNDFRNDVQPLLDQVHAVFKKYGVHR